MKPLLVFLLVAGSIQAAGQTAPDSAIETESPVMSENQKKAYERGISVLPATLSFQAGQGMTDKKTVTVTNNTADTFQININTMDWERDSLGVHVYLPGGTSKHSCFSWVSYDKNFLVLPPGSSEVVTVTMTVPDSAEAVSEMKWSMMVVGTGEEKMAPQKVGKLNVSINKKTGFGIHIYQTPPSLHNKEIKMLAFSKAPKGDSYRITCQNTGGLQVRGTFTIELGSMETGEKITLGPQDIPMFPGQRRLVDFQLPKDLPKGKYSAVALIDVGDDDVPLEAAELEVEVK